MTPLPQTNKLVLTSSLISLPRILLICKLRNCGADLYNALEINSLGLQEVNLLSSFLFLRESNREVDAEIDAFLSSKSPKKPVDPLSYIKVCSFRRVVFLISI